MAGYILCQTQVARQPYLIENIQMNIYSIEELCYYLYNNIYLTDRTIMNEGLCRWVENDLGLSSLARKLRGHIGKFAGIEDFVYPVFKEINYLSYDQLKSLNAQLAAFDDATPSGKNKIKADCFMKNGMYMKAINLYQGILDEEKLLDESTLQPEQPVSEKPGEEKAAFLAAVWHNLGCADARLFQMEKACECFMESYRLSENDDELVCALLACRSVRTPLEYESFLEEIGADDAVREKIREKLEHFERLPETPVYSQHVDELLDRFMHDYHRAVRT